MRYHEILDEKVINLDIDNNTLRITENPNWNQIQNLLKVAPENELRGLIDGDGNFYVWIAYEAGHARVANALVKNYGSDLIDVEKDNLIIKSKGACTPNDTSFWSIGGAMNPEDRQYRNVFTALKGTEDKSLEKTDWTRKSIPTDIN